MDLKQKPKYEAFQGDNGMWGVGGADGHGVLYEADFARITAEAIADMENSDKPPKDWEEAKQRLKAAGLPY